MALTLLSLALLGCSATPDKLGFTKVKYYHLQDEDPRAESMSIDPMIRFRRQHFLHGAVTREEKKDRLGHYYSLYWNGRGNGGRVTLRFEYRHALAGERVFTYEQVIEDVQARNRTSLTITGEPYHQYGRVVAWQASLVEEGTVLDSTRSFLWQ